MSLIRPEGYRQAVELLVLGDIKSDAAQIKLAATVVVGGADTDPFQPMNVNFGLFPPLDTKLKGGRRGRHDRRAAYARRALDAVDVWLEAETGA